MFLSVSLGALVDILTHLVDAPAANIFILAGIFFLGIAAVGKIGGWIEPTTMGRLMSGALGAILFIYGVHEHSLADSTQNQTASTQNQTAVAPVSNQESNAQATAGKSDVASSVNKASTAERSTPAPYPNFSGTWEVIEITQDGKALNPVEPPLTITQNGASVYVSGIEHKITSGVITWQKFFATDDQHGHAVQSENQADLVLTYTGRVEGEILIMEVRYDYKRPFISHPADGAHMRILKYRRFQ